MKQVFLPIFVALVLNVQAQITTDSTRKTLHSLHELVITGEAHPKENIISYVYKKVVEEKIILLFRTDSLTGNYTDLTMAVINKEEYDCNHIIVNLQREKEKDLTSVAFYNFTDNQITLHVGDNIPVLPAKYVSTPSNPQSDAKKVFEHFVAYIKQLLKN